MKKMEKITKLSILTLTALCFTSAVHSQSISASPRSHNHPSYAQYVETEIPANGTQVRVMTSLNPKVGEETNFVVLTENGDRMRLNHYAFNQGISYMFKTDLGQVVSLTDSRGLYMPPYKRGTVLNVILSPTD